MKVRLGQRNLFYSMILAGSMLTFLVGYFVYMLPSLYVDYKMEQNLKAVTEQHKAYSEQGSYADVQVANPTACFSVTIPDEGDSIRIVSKLFSVNVTVKEERLREVFDEVRIVLQEYSGETPEEEKTREDFEETVQRWEGVLRDVFSENQFHPVQVDLLEQQEFPNEYHGEYEKMHGVSDRFVILEMGVEDSRNKYVNYIAAERKEDSLILTFLPVMTPDMNEIRPIVMQSLPMLGTVIFLLVLLFSQVYSRGIVTPIVRLVHHTEQMKGGYDVRQFPAGEIREDRGDEIGMLAATIEELYQKLRASYEELEGKNQVLEEENKRQEVLLRASSHQLKTPISAALLLVDGMKNNIGKYRDREKYLPKVKEQLLSMKKMVADILYLEHCGENLDFGIIEIRDAVNAQLAFYRVPIGEKELQVSVEGTRTAETETDPAVFSHILSNLLSNAVNYTPQGGKIRIFLEEERLTIQNYGVRIEEDLLPHIFEPFVSGNHEKKQGGVDSHGLGLYIAAYYAKKLGMKLEIGNTGDSVTATLLYFTLTPIRPH